MKLCLALLRMVRIHGVFIRAMIHCMGCVKSNGMTTSGILLTRTIFVLAGKYYIFDMCCHSHHNWFHTHCSNLSPVMHDEKGSSRYVRACVCVLLYVHSGRIESKDQKVIITLQKVQSINPHTTQRRNVNMPAADAWITYVPHGKCRSMMMVTGALNWFGWGSYEYLILHSCVFSIHFKYVWHFTNSSEAQLLLACHEKCLRYNLKSTKCDTAVSSRQFTRPDICNMPMVL